MNCLLDLFCSFYPSEELRGFREVCFLTGYDRIFFLVMCNTVTVAEIIFLSCNSDLKRCVNILSWLRTKSSFSYQMVIGYAGMLFYFNFKRTSLRM